MKKIGWLVALGCMVAWAGCTTTIKYTPPAALPGAGKTPLRVAVYDFADRTGGDYTMDWDAGWTYDNVGEVVAEAVAAVLARSGHFGAVERVRRQFGGQPPVTGTFDLLVVGEVKQFRTGNYPHPTVFINPICLGFFLGLPTYYAYEEGIGEASVAVLKADPCAAIEQVFVKGKFGPDFFWGSWSTAWADRQHRGQKCLAALEDDFREQLRKRLDESLGQTLLAMAGSAISSPSVSPPPTSAAALAVGPPPGAAGRYAVVVGLSKYQRTGAEGLTELAFAAADARGFRDALVAQGWKPDHIKCLTDAEATKAEVEKWLRYGPDLGNELFVVFWAGHGYPDQVDARRLFFACYDTDVANPATGLRMGDVRAWLEDRKARNVVIVADACNAGGLISGRSRDLSVRGLAGCMRPDSVPPGWVYLLGERAGDKAVEHPALRGGLFTHSFIEALAGGADGYGMLGRKDGAVTLGEIREYVRDKVKEKAFQLNLAGAFETQDHVNTGDDAIWNLTLKAK